MHDLSIIIVTYNSSNEIKACLDAVFTQQDCSFEVIIVDNHSADDTLSHMEAFKDKLQLIASDKNLGFGAACNLAAKQAQGDYIYLLNPDAFLQDEKSLKRMVKTMRENPQWGLAGTRICEDDKEVLPRYTYPYEKYLKGSFNHLPGDIAWHLGASVVLPRAAYEQCHGFDENFFLYGEEVDLCLRIRKAGFELGYIDDVTVAHIGGASEVKATSYDYWIRKQKGLHNFIHKHYSKEDINTILKKESRKARFRMLSLKFSKKAANKEKYHRYRAIFDSSIAKKP